jgi:hypothetical protein
MTVAAFGTWLTVRSRPRASREELGEFSGLPALGQFAPFAVDDDRAAEIIAQFAPALDAVFREVFTYELYEGNPATGEP